MSGSARKLLDRVLEVAGHGKKLGAEVRTDHRSIRMMTEDEYAWSVRERLAELLSRELMVSAPLSEDIRESDRRAGPLPINTTQVSRIEVVVMSAADYSTMCEGLRRVVQMLETEDRLDSRLGMMPVVHGTEAGRLPPIDKEEK